jgi:hypothetical protein
MEEVSTKLEKTIEEQALIAARIIAKYPGRVPICIDPAPNARVPTIDKRKFLVPRDFTMGQMIFTIRKRMELNATQAIFVYIMQKGKQEVLAQTSATMGDIYDKYQEADGMVYLQYASENAFGSDQ